MTAAGPAADMSEPSNTGVFFRFTAAAISLTTPYGRKALADHDSERLNGEDHNRIVPPQTSIRRNRRAWGTIRDSDDENNVEGSHRKRRRTAPVFLHGSGSTPSSHIGKDHKDSTVNGLESEKEIGDGKVREYFSDSLDIDSNKSPASRAASSTPPPDTFVKRTIEGSPELSCSPSQGLRQPSRGPTPLHTGHIGVVPPIPSPFRSAKRSMSVHSIPETEASLEEARISQKVIKINVDGADDDYPDPEESDSDGEGGAEQIWEVERVLDWRPRVESVEHHDVDLLVKWVGFGDTHNTWEPEGQLQSDCPEAVFRFWEGLNKKTPRSTQKGHKRKKAAQARLNGRDIALGIKTADEFIVHSITGHRYVKDRPVELRVQWQRYRTLS